MTLKKIILVSTVLALSACSSTSYKLSPEASKVEFVDVKPSDSCQFIGQAEGTRGAFFVGTKTHSELMRDAAVDLLNKAAQMGGNVVYNAQDATMRIVSDLIPTDAIMSGEVYKCP